MNKPIGRPNSHNKSRTVIDSTIRYIVADNAILPIYESYEGDVDNDSIRLVFKKSNFMEHQWNFITANEEFVAMVTGYGSGKTFAFVRKTLYHHIGALNASGISRGIIVYPTLKQARSLFIEPFKELLRSVGISYEYRSSEGRLTTAYGIIDIYTMQKAERIVGEEYTYGGVDELDVESTSIAKLTVEKILGRLRGNEKVIFYAVTTPEGYKFAYKFFVEEYDDTKKLIRAKSTDNPYLSKAYIRSLIKQYDKERVKQYICGEFVNLVGTRAIYNFNRDVHTKPIGIGDYSDGDLWIGMDFNVNPMTAVITRAFVNRRTQTLESLIVVGEISLPNSNTRKMIEHINTIFPNKRLNFVVDVSGNQRHTNAEATDIQIIKSYGHNVFAKRVLERQKIDNLNLMLSEGTIVVSKNAKLLIRDLEAVVIGKDNKIDKSNQDLTHSLDALGYLAFHLTRKQQESTAR